MSKTSIEWVKNPDGSQGYTWNPITGCLNGCPYCYARKLANGRLKARYLANDNFCPAGNPVERGHARSDPFYPRFWAERLLQPWDLNRKWKPKGIFVCDMGELFGDWIPKQWQEEVFKVIKNNSQHRFYLLTKQPQNLSPWSPFPDNCWVGVTATDDSMLRTACINLAQVNAKVKYISFEPLLEWSDYFSGVLKRSNSLGDRWMKSAGIKWVIIGAQTKPTLLPKIEDVEEIVRACDKAGVKVFLKNNLEPLWTLENSSEPFFRFSRPSPGATAIGKLRQEMPK